MPAALLIAAILVLPGFVVLAAARASGAEPWPWPRGAAVCLALGVTIASFAAIVLGVLGRYSLAAECVTLAAVCAGGGALAGFRLAWPFTRAPLAESVGFVLVGGLAAALFFGHPFEMLLGERDATVYTVSGIGLARQGSLVLHDVGSERIGADAARELYPLGRGEGPSRLRLPRSVKYPGFYYTDLDRTEIIAQGFAALPAVIAIFYGAFGVAGAFAASNAIGVLAVLAVFAAGTALIGEIGALLGTTILTLSIVEVWAARYPVAEILFQMMLFAAFAAFLRGDRVGQAIAGFLLGATLFVKVEAALALAPVLAFGAVSVARRRRVVDRALWIVLAATVAAALLYWVGFQADYVRSAFRTFSSFGRRFAKAFFVTSGAWSVLALVLTVAGVSAALAIRSRLQSGAAVFVSRASAFSVILFVAYGYWVRPYFSGIVVGQQMTLVWLGWYLTPVVVLVGFAGVAHYLATQARAPALFVLGIALTLAAVFLHFTFVNTIHPYLTRRFVPAAAPIACLFFGHAIVWLGTRGEGRARLAAGGLAALVFLGCAGAVALRSRQLYGHREYPGLERRLAALADDLRGADVVFLSDRPVRNLLGATLEFVYGLPTVVVWRGGYADKAHLIRRWSDEGKTIAVLTSLTDLANVPGADEFEPIDRPALKIRALQQVENRFADEVAEDTMQLSRYATGPGSHPLYGYWQRNGEALRERVCGAGMRILHADPFLLRRILARCPDAQTAGTNAAVLVGDAEAGDWEAALALYGARFVRHDLGGVVLFDEISPQREPSASRLPAEDWTLEASDGRGSEHLAVDGRLDTRWGSRAPQRPGMTFTVGFREPTDLDWLKVRMGRFSKDRARELSLETSVDGERWERRDVPGVVAGMRWNDGALEETNGDLDLLVKARAVRFVRLVNRGESSVFDWSIAELEIDGRPTATKP